MKDTVTQSTFTDWFQKHRPNNFSYDGTKALYAYLAQLEEDCGTEFEFDPIAICCEWSEYQDLDELNEAYNNDYDFESLCEDTQVIVVGEDHLIIQAF